MGKMSLAIRTLMMLLLATNLWSCGSTSGEGVDEDSNLVSEIDEATSDISEEEGGDEESLLSESDEEGGAEEEFASEYEEGEEGEQAAVEEGGDEEAGDEMAAGDEEGEFEDEEFADEDFEDEDFAEEGEEVAGGDEEGFDEFEDFEEGEEGADREVAQEEGENPRLKPWMDLRKMPLMSLLLKAETSLLPMWERRKLEPRGNTLMPRWKTRTS